MQWLREFAKRVLPDPVVDWIRRRRAVRQYLNALGHEIYDRTVRLELDDLEGRIAARRDGFYERLVQDVLERTELILQELDRKIEGVSARHGNEIRELRMEVQTLRESLSARATGGVRKTGAPRAPLKGSAKVSPLPSTEPIER